MSRKNLRSGKSVAGDEVVDEVDVVVNVESVPSTVEPDIINTLCEKFGDKLKIEFNKIVQSLKFDIASELKSRDSRISALEAEVASLKESQQTSDEKSARVYTNIDSIVEEVDRISEACQKSPSAAVNSDLDVLIAGDSIVKHLDVDSLNENCDNELICIPGARAHKVHHGIMKFTRTHTPSDIVFHVGANHIPRQTPAEVVAEITDTLKKLQLSHPSTKIHFSAVLPKLEPFYNRGIDFLNRKIRELCEEYGMGFIHHPGFRDAHGFLNEKLYAPTEWRLGKPLHPSHEGVRSLMNDFKRHFASS